MKTIVFDFDGTLTKKSHEIWTKIWKRLDAMDIDYKLYLMYKNKEIDYIKWCQLIEDEYIKLGFNQDMLMELSNGIELMDNLEETLITLKNKGYHLYIISGGIDKIIYNKLGNLVKYFDKIHSCIFDFDNNGNLTRIIPTKYDDEGKKLFIDEHCLNTNTDPKEITFIGNGDNDEYVYLSGCRTICINPAKNTNYNNKTIWHNVIDNSKDMRKILTYFDL